MVVFLLKVSTTVLGHRVALVTYNNNTRLAYIIFRTVTYYIRIALSKYVLSNDICAEFKR